MKQVKSHAGEKHLLALAEHAEWEWMLMQVLRFRQQHGHLELGNHPAGGWLEGLGQQALAGRLSALKRQRLEECGLPMPKAERRRKEVPEAVAVLREDDVWEGLYERLDAWQEQHGHCEVPRAWADDPELARWTNVQRRLREQRRLTPSQEARLDVLGFFRRRQGSPNSAAWEERYVEMVAFQTQHGHTNVTAKVNKRLAHWRDTQREFRMKGMLSADRIAKLGQIGFEWEAAGRTGLSKEAWNERLWEEKLEQLEAFKERFGHCHVPVLWEENQKLGGWVAEQRKRHREGKLPEARMMRLEELGFQWKVPARFFEPPFKTEHALSRLNLALWEQRYTEMVAFQKQHGHTKVPVKVNKELSYWRETQREFRRMGKLREDRIARLDQIGFEWAAPERKGKSLEAWREERWETQLQRLKVFKERFGHTRVPQRWEEDPVLAEWVSGQRKRWKEGKLPPMQQMRLEALGFDWLPQGRVRIRPPRPPRPSVTREDGWDQRYLELTAFQQQHGHCLVPCKTPETKPLSAWCYSQRQIHRAGKLRADRVARLEALGFRWDATEVPGLTYEERHAQMWEQSFERLVQFYHRHGHAQVPVAWEEDLELGGWVYKQRHKARQGRLSAERRARLEALAFSWQPDNRPVVKPRPPQNFPKPAHERVWWQHYEELCSFQKEQRHLRVPKKHGALGLWCGAQRKALRGGKLMLVRKEALDAIGFPWCV